MDQQKIMQYAQTSFSSVQQRRQMLVWSQASCNPHWAIIWTGRPSYLHDVINFKPFCQNKTKIIICMIFGCRFGFCDTYISGRQVGVTTKPKLVLANFFNSFLGGLRCVRESNQVLKYVSWCTEFDIKTSNNKAYQYILECIWYLPIPGGIFLDFLRPFSFPSSTRAFHSIYGIIRGCSYLGLFSRWILYWSRTIFKCFPAFYRTFDASKVSVWTD